jgi:uncharacterized membrane protein YeaQ/YmgE (transglycosylase-associated protein family)
MGILSWITIGLVVGWLVGMVIKGVGYGVIGSIIVGIIGALLSGFLATNFFGVQGAVSGLNLTSILVTFVSIVLTISILRDLSPGDTSV